MTSDGYFRLRLLPHILSALNLIPQCLTLVCCMPTAPHHHQRPSPRALSFPATNHQDSCLLVTLQLAFGRLWVVPW